jgi:hypothetical protein
MTVVKNKTTKENREFWEYCEQVAAEVAKWPAWMRGGSVEEAPKNLDEKE